MEAFILCFLRVVLYTLGVATACGLAVEICYRLCFMLMGKRAGRSFWLVTSLVGAPVHELGHAIACLVFAHRIENIRLLPTRAGMPLVDHSYNRRNPYAVFGNLWIGLGPIFAGLAVILLVLYWVYPDSLQAYREAVEVLLKDGAPTERLLDCVGQFLRGLWTEQTRAWWVRLIAAAVLFSMALHVRLSAADVWGMLAGLPAYAVLAAALSLIAVLIGQGAIDALTLWLSRISWLVVSLFSLILLFALVQLVPVVLYRLLCALARAVRGKPGYDA